MKNTSAIDLVIELGKQIALLREDLAQKEQELMNLITPGKAERPTQPVQHAHVMHGRTLHGSISERVRQYIAANPERPIPVAEIIAAHRTEDAATIRSTVHRLATGGMGGFSAVSHGTYRYQHERPFADVRVGVQHEREARS
jgi:hypothetical protein